MVFDTSSQTDRLIEDILTESDRELIQSRGYTIRSRVDSGNLRIALFANYINGLSERNVVLKIPRREVANSLSARVNSRRRNVDRREVRVLDELSHPNIVRTIDSFLISGDRVVNAEDFHQGANLHSDVRIKGGYYEEQFERVFGPIIDAFFYLHRIKQIVHRDVKPSNILIPNRGRVMITDFQNAEFINHIRYHAMPTKGGSEFTLPQTLNAMVLGESSDDPVRGDIYALGHTIYYALTGRLIYNHKLVEHESGRAVIIDGQEYRLKIARDGKFVDRLDLDEHEEMLRSACRRVDSKYGKLIYRMMTQTGDGIEDMGKAKEEYKELESGRWTLFKERVAQGSHYLLPTIAAAGIIAVGTIAGINSAGKEPKPTFSEMLRNDNYCSFSLGNLQITEDTNGLEYPQSFIRNYYIDILHDRWKEIEKNTEVLAEEDLQTYAMHHSTFLRMDRRLVISWLRSCMMNKEKAERGYRSRKEDRVSPTFVPRNFLVMNDTSIGGPNFHPANCSLQGVSYLKLCLGPEMLDEQVNLPELMATYFCDTLEQNIAKQRTGSWTYFPAPVNADDRSMSFNHGYRSMIPRFKQNLIETAVALYLITDEEGEVHFDRIPKRTFMPGTYTSGEAHSRMYGLTLK